MKICITSTGETLESQVDPRFGRCSFFLIINPASKEYEVIKNEQQQSGAGIHSGQIIAAKDVTAVLTGHVGPNAFQILNAADIKVYNGISGKVSDVINKYNNGELLVTDKPTVDSHFGMNQK